MQSTSSESSTILRTELVQAYKDYFDSNGPGNHYMGNVLADWFVNALNNPIVIAELKKRIGVYNMYDEVKND